jgi:N-terminal acetyltransferase 2
VRNPWLPLELHFRKEHGLIDVERAAQVEHFVMSYAEKVIPQSLKDLWHNYRQSLKDAEKEQLGSNEISQDVEMAGWGVREADEAHKAEASKLS